MLRIDYDANLVWWDTPAFNESGLSKAARFEPRTLHTLVTDILPGTESISAPEDSSRGYCAASEISLGLRDTSNIS